jgi:hypothetical protein
MVAPSSEKVKTKRQSSTEIVRRTGNRRLAPFVHDQLVHPPGSKRGRDCLRHGETRRDVGQELRSTLRSVRALYTDRQLVESSGESAIRSWKVEERTPEEDHGGLLQRSATRTKYPMGGRTICGSRPCISIVEPARRDVQ